MTLKRIFVLNLISIAAASTAQALAASNVDLSDARIKQGYEAGVIEGATVEKVASCRKQGYKVNFRSALKRAHRGAPIDTNFEPGDKYRIGWDAGLTDGQAQELNAPTPCDQK
jgi:hypothetical protein